MRRDAFDPQTPELADLFVPSRLCAWLARQLGGARAGHATPRRARVERCWPARGGLRFQWTCLLPDVRGRVSLFGVPARPTDRREAREVAAWCSGMPSVWRYIAPLDLVVHTADQDAGMPQVATLLDPDRLGPLVRDWLPDPDAPLRTTLLGYKPGRRAAVRLEVRVGRRWRTVGVIKAVRARGRSDAATKRRSDEATKGEGRGTEARRALGAGARDEGRGTRAERATAVSAVDAYADSRASRSHGSQSRGTSHRSRSHLPTFQPSHLPTAPLARWHAELAGQLADRTGGRIAVPRVLGEIAALGAVLIEWVPGRRLGAGAVLGPDELRATAGALAAFHQLSPPAGVPAFGRGDELAVLRRWCAALERVRPRKAAAARRLLDALASAAQRIDPRPAALLHRDFYEKQLVWSERCTTILDLDTLATGEAELDVGNLISHAALYQMCRRRAPVSMAELSAICDAVLRAYRQAGGVADEAAVRWYAASSLARGGALHGLRTRTRRVSPWMWALSEALLTSAAASRRPLAAAR